MDNYSSYFGNWVRVINKNKLEIALKNACKKTPVKNICPAYKNIFRAFSVCPYEELKIVMIGRDPYPQEGVATGILFGNKAGTSDKNLSISLQIIKESVINFEIPHNFITFDPTLEEWSKQGILLINSALTVEMNKPGSHTMIWRDFVSSLLKNLSLYNNGLIYVLFGKQAETFEPYIDKHINTVLKVQHPAYFARVHKRMPGEIFRELEKTTKEKFNFDLKLYNYDEQ